MRTRHVAGRAGPELDPLPPELALSGPVVGSPTGCTPDPLVVRPRAVPGLAAACPVFGPAELWLVPGPAPAAPDLVPGPPDVGGPEFGPLVPGVEGPPPPVF